MRNSYVKKETVFFQGKKGLLIIKTVRWQLLLLCFVLFTANADAQLPALSYPGPKTYGEGQTISLAPSSSGVAAFGYSNTVTPYGSGFKIPYDLATDAAGNLYVADNYYGVIKIPAGNGTPVSLNATGAISVAVDAAGNVYYSSEVYTDPNSDGNGIYEGYVFKLPVGSNTPVQLDYEYDEWLSLTADPEGNVYIAGFDGEGDSELEEIPAGTTTVNYLEGATGSSIPIPVPDAIGNFFYASYNFVAEKLARGGTELTFPGNFPDLEGITVDANDNVYVVDNVTGHVTMIAARTSSGPQTIIGPAYANSTGIAVDGAGNVYVSSYKDNSAPGFVTQLKPTGGYFITPQLPAGLSMDNNTGIISGRATVASPATKYTITAYNATGSTSTTVSIKIAQGSSNADLMHLMTTRGVITPAFSASTTSYTASVVNGVTSFQLTPITASPFASVTINGVAVADSAMSAALPLAVGANTFNIVVTAPDAVTTKTYSLVVTRAGNSIDNLSTLTCSAGTLSPAFSSTTTSYTLNVANATRTATVTPTAQDTSATIKVNGTTVASGASSPSIPLAVGATTISIVVTSSNGTATKTYTITVNRPASNNDNLSNLTANNGVLSPAFASATTSYTEEVINGVTTVSVYPTAQDPDATITVNGTTVASGSESPAYPLSVGSNTVTVAVTASDGVTSKTYTVTITRDPSTVANLSSLTTSSGTLVPGPFSPTTYNYTTNVGYEDSLFTVTPTTAVNGATVKVNGISVASGSASGPIALAVGSNTVTIVVTGATGTTTKTYKLTVTRAASVNPDLYALQINNGSLTPAFSPDTLNYTDNVVNSATTVRVTPTASDPHSTITVNGATVASGSASAAIHLNVGANTISLVVTTPDGTMTKTYTLTITRAAASANSFDEVVSVSKPTETTTLADDGIVVHQAVSPNGDGINDFLQIENISQFPDNKLSIMNRNGQLIYEATGYDNSSKVFDGHSNKSGQLQLPGTYFYELDYTVNGITKHKTGYLVLKY